MGREPIKYVKSLIYRESNFIFNYPRLPRLKNVFIYYIQFLEELNINSYI